jgi:hypothetical protein
MAVGVMMATMADCADGPGERGPAGAREGAGEASDVRVVTDAAEATRRVTSGRVELATAYRNLSGGPEPGPRIIQRAAFDDPAGRAEAEMDMSELAAVLDEADEAVAGDYTRPSRVVVVEGTVYSQLGPLAAEVGLDPATWVTRDVAGLDDQALDNDTLALLVQPLGALDLLRLPVLAARAAGSGEVRGEPAERYRLTLDLSPSKVNGHGGSESIEARLRALGLSQLELDVWVAGDGTVRRLSFSLDPEAGSRGAPGSPGTSGASDAAGAAPAPGAGGLTTTFELYAVGDPVDVDVPSGPEVIDQAELRARILDR